MSLSSFSLFYFNKLILFLHTADVEVSMYKVLLFTTPTLSAILWGNNSMELYSPLHSVTDCLKGVFWEGIHYLKPSILERVLHIIMYLLHPVQNVVSSCMLSRGQLFATLWIVARQAPLSMGFSRQEY